MTPPEPAKFVPAGFDPPTTLAGAGFVLEPLGVQHNGPDHEAWMSSIDHIRSTPGFADRGWPREMSLDENRADLDRHHRDFRARTGFTFTVLDPGRSGEVIGCVYIYPPSEARAAAGHDAEVRSWVRADRASLDGPLYAAVSAWLAAAWPFAAPYYAPRPGTVAVRRLTGADWDQVYPFFRAIVAAGDTYAYPPGLPSAEARRLWVAEPPGATVVAADGDRVLGSASMGPNRPGRGSHVATASFMVSPEARGRGVGRLLGEYVIGWAEAGGYRAIQFNAVVETNTAAVNLWRSLGFEILTTVPEAFEHAEHGFVGLHIMHRRLGAPAASVRRGGGAEP